MSWQAYTTFLDILRPRSHAQVVNALRAEGYAFSRIHAGQRACVSHSMRGRDDFVELALNSETGPPHGRRAHSPHTRLADQRRGTPRQTRRRTAGCERRRSAGVPRHALEPWLERERDNC
jgi:hypothetical protein